MLARLLETEQLTSSRVPSAYRNAAFNLTEQMAFHGDVAVLQCARLAEEWMEHAIEASTASTGGASQLTDLLRKDREELQKSKQMVAYSFVVGRIRV
ncbi:hypothetical protein LTR85_006745 [Meristemomyces frigidus]|nr:hypothetical protein LTR85_006745 [Meristemomyces frigidus]